MSYSALAVTAVVAVLVVDLAVYRTRMVTRPVFWTAYADDQGRPCDVDLPYEPTPVELPAESLSAVVDALMDNVFHHTPPSTEVGVAVVSYFDTAAKSGATEKTTAPIGVVFAFAALFASAIYTVWIDKYHRVLDCTSMQLLLNQAPVSVGVMLFIIPFSDDITVWAAIDSHTWMLVLLV